MVHVVPLLMLQQIIQGMNVLKRCPRVRIPPKAAFPSGNAEAHSSKPPLPFFSTVISVLLSWSYPAINQSTVLFVLSRTSLQVILSTDRDELQACIFCCDCIASLTFQQQWAVHWLHCFVWYLLRTEDLSVAFQQREEGLTFTTRITHGRVLIFEFGRWQNISTVETCIQQKQ